MPSLSQRGVRSEEVARATLQCTSGYFKKLRTPSGAVTVGVKQSERRGGTWGWGVPLAGPRGAHLPVRRQVASDERSGPRAAGKSVLLDASVEYTAFIAIGSCPPSRRRKGHVPRKGNTPSSGSPTFFAPHNGESEAVFTSARSPRSGAGASPYRPTGGSFPA